jgi:exonuclease SbcC
MKDTQQKSKDLLGMDCDTFQSCVLIMQDRYGKFMEASKENRMNVLASLLGLGIYDELEKLAKAKLTDVNRDVKTIKEVIAKLETDVSIEESLQTESGQIEVSLVVANDDLKTARDELAGYQKQLTEIEGFVREMSTLEQEVKAKTDSYTDKKARKEKLENDVFLTESFLKNEQTILDKCAELDKTRLAIASLDGRVQLLNDKKQRCAKVNLEIVQIKNSRNGIAGQLKTISESLKDKDELEAVVKDSTVEAELEAILKKESEYKTLDTKRQITVQRCCSMEKQSEMLADAQCVDIEKAQCRFLKSAKEAKKTLDESKQELKELNEAIDKLGYNIYERDRLLSEVKTYREAKDRLSKMAADNATADELYKQHVELSNRLNNLDIEIKGLSDEIAVLEKDTGGLAELKSTVDGLLRYEKQIMDLPKAKQFVESSNEEISHLTVDLSGLQEAIDKANIRLAEIQGLTGDKHFTELNQLQKTQDIRILESKISDLNRQIGTIKAKLEVIVGQKVQLQEKQSELQSAAKSASQLQILVEAFSQDGIPYQIIRDIVPELEASANEILGQMTGGRMRLEFITEKIVKSNKAKEVATLEIIIIDVDNGTLPYLSRSGGQKVRAALANSFALAMIKASRVGLQLGMLFIDEPSFLDVDGIEGYCQALETIHNRYPEMRILAISHDENMKSRFPQQLYVDITENGSKVQRAA